MKRNMTRFFAGIIITCLLVTAIPTVGAAAEGTSVISASSVSAECGSSVDVVISLDSNPGIWSMGLKVGYDHSALTLTGWTAGDIFNSGEVTPPPSLNKETYFFVASRDSLSDTTATGTLVTLTFAVAANAICQGYPITLTLSNKNTININDENVAFNTVNGMITVVPETVTITFDAAGGSAVPSVSGSIGSTVATPATPKKAGFAFAGWFPAIPAVYPVGGLTLTAQWVALGDINADNKVSPIDALMALQAASEKITLTGTQKLAADVNKNGSISALDALMVLQYASGNITSFPN